ncbi:MULTISPECIES: hypothetical protein [unclassified Sutcliffiella]|uniref:hypothetical protein n=1 Tax=unclassified Sutcliffiella TaxID=2837532 RepID=UPI0030D40448
MIAVNNVYFDKFKNIKFRLLWINPNNIYGYVIDCGEKQKLPYIINISELNRGLIGNEIEHIEDEFTDLVRIDSLSPKLQSESLKAWNIIKDIVTVEPDIYIRDQRYRLIEKQIAEFKVSDVTIYHYLKRYWSGGMTQNALANKKYNSGGRGKDKFLKSKKTGRPNSEHSPYTGLNVDEKVKGQIRSALKTHYFEKHRSTYKFAYKMMLLEHYSEKIINPYGQEELVTVAASPSYRQFIYWAKKLYTSKEIIEHKEGSKAYERDHRGLLGSSVYETNGPGSRFEIDSTPANMYIVSAYDRNKIIGKPTIYICVDVFSRLVTGFHVGLESVSSWDGAIAAMVNTITNKKELCQKYGIEMEEFQWPSSHFPKVLLADKAEFIGYNSDSLESNFNITIENTSSYRGDMKGTVEKLLDLIPEHIYLFAPGTIEKDFQQRGGKDYRLEAKLTLKEFSQLMIRCILHYNGSYLKTYPFTKAMFEDGLKAKPKDIWHWGIRNYAGDLKSYTPNYVYIHLLPGGVGVIKRDGLHFKGARYSAKIIEDNNWLSKARVEGNWRVNVRYDKRFTEEIYMEYGNKLYPCYLLPHQERYFDVSFEDIEYLNEFIKKERAQEDKHQVGRDITLYHNLQTLTKEYVEKANIEIKKTISIPKSHIIKNIKENRRKERQINSIIDQKALVEKTAPYEKETGTASYKKKSILALGLYKGGHEYEN